MSAIEFTAPTGKTFSVQLYNATTLAAIGAAITPVTDTAGIYRASTGANTGIVYVEATATNILVAGFANLDDAAANGYSPLRDTYDEANTKAGVRSAVGLASANLDTQLGAIAEKTATIGTGVISGSSPVSDTGNIAEIIIGDDYKAANGRAFTWTVAAPTGFTLADCTCHFGGNGGVKGSWNISGTITDAGSGNWLLSFDLLGSHTASCSKGKYEWSVAVHNSSGIEITKVRSDSTKVELVEKFT